MAIGLQQPGKLFPVRGVTLSSVTCGIKANGEKDICLIVVPEAATCAATFTRNAFCAAPVTVAKRHLENTAPRALLINSGNANAGTGKRGLGDAQRSCEWVAEHVGCSIEEVLPFSTGVIGEYLPMQKIEEGIKQASSCLSDDN